jgi:hypothetical protein
MGFIMNKYERLMGLNIVPDRNVSDLIHRSWKQRLFSWPWKPWVKYQRLETCYIINDMAIVSYETYNKILKDNPELNISKFPSSVPIIRNSPNIL